MKHIVDYESWERKDNFSYFKDFLNPFIAVTSEVKCGGCKTKTRREGSSFFLSYLYAILRAVNEIKELKYRVDSKGQIVIYDRIDVLSPIKMKENGKFYTVRILYNENFEEFYQDAQAAIQNIPEDGDPYAVENAEAEKDSINVVLVSAVPDLYFTSIVPTQKHKNGSDYPLITVGKAVQREGEAIMPITLAVHHGFIDGFHIADFFRRVEVYLKTE